MKKILWPLAVVVSLTAAIFLSSSPSAKSDIAKYEAMLATQERVPAQAVVKLSPAGRRSLRGQVADVVLGGRNFKLKARGFETSKDFFTVTLADDHDLASYLEAMNKNPAVAYAEPNFIYHADGYRTGPGSMEQVPNDPNFSQLWGMKNTGQQDSTGIVGVAGADIGATKAWAMTTGNKDIVVAVIDTGVDYTHPDLRDNIYVNPGESGSGKETNAKDDDRNGFVDDVHGWNFAGVSTNDPMDDNHHGTHVSGTIGAKGNDGVGVAGVAWNVSILPVKFLDSGGSGSLDNAVKAIQYATMKHVNIMSNSWGGGSFSQALYDAIADAKKQGILFVAAAGNDGSSSDSTAHYPGSYQLDNVLAVAATTNQDTLASFSNYGKRTVPISAPGNNILSSVPGGYDTFSGTSMATPHVSGAAALLWSTNKAMSYLEVKDRLLRSRDFVPALARKVATGGRLNIYNAIAGIYPPSPEPSESDWKDFAISKPVESAHPYAESTNGSWTIQGPKGTKFIRVHFSKFATEAGYDFVKVFDGNGTEMDSVSGNGDDSYSSYVNGDKVTIRFSSDTSVNGWGFAIDKLQVISGP